MRFSLTRMSLIGICQGGLGGALIARLPSSALSTPLSTLLGALYGLLFAWLLAGRITSVGSGLIWGLGYAFLLWLAVPTGLLPLLQGAASMGMLDQARAHFPELVAYILCFGFPLGVITGVTCSINRIADVPPAHAKRLRPTAWGAVSSVAIAACLRAKLQGKDGLYVSACRHGGRARRAGWGMGL